MKLMLSNEFIELFKEKTPAQVTGDCHFQLSKQREF